MIGVAVNGIALLIWLGLWGTGAMSLDSLTAPIAISVVGLLICALMDALS